MCLIGDWVTFTGDAFVSLALCTAKHTHTATHTHQQQHLPTVTISHGLLILWVTTTYAVLPVILKRNQQVLLYGTNRSLPLLFQKHRFIETYHLLSEEKAAKHRNYLVIERKRDMQNPWNSGASQTLCKMEKKKVRKSILIFTKSARRCEYDRCLFRSLKLVCGVCNHVTWSDCSGIEIRICSSHSTGPRGFLTPEREFTKKLGPGVKLA